MRTAELDRAALNWAVAKCEEDILWLGNQPFFRDVNNSGERVPFVPSTNWSQGGPIIEREKIRLNYGVGEEGFYCEAYITAGTCQHGPTPLTAAMRCYVASKLGDKVDVPEELSC
jgi:hypothetical protein